MSRVITERWVMNRCKLENADSASELSAAGPGVPNTDGRRPLETGQLRGLGLGSTTP